MDPVDPEQPPPVVRTRRTFNFVENIIFILGFLLFSLAIGMIIYRLLADMSWVDSFYNATMILSGAGPPDPLYNSSAKIAAGIYSLYSAVVFLVIIAAIIDGVVDIFVFHPEDT